MAVLADKDYHGGVRGVDPRTIRIIKNCGNTAIISDDIILCYWDIMLLHHKIMEGWTNTCTNQSGPSVEWIMEKAMPLFKKLVGVTTVDAIHFYDESQKNGSVYVLPFMPFDAVCLKLEFEGLCPPGLSIECYAAIATALMELIPCLLPDHIASWSTIIATVWADLNNGFDLMWRLLALAVLGFDPALHILAPVWEAFLDIFDFCHEHIPYFCLQAKRGLYYDERTCSLTFLRAIQQIEYVDVVTTLQRHIDSYQDMDAAFLPPNLCMLELANRIIKSTKACVFQYGLPRANRMYSGDWGMEYDSSTSPQIQGFTPSVFCTNFCGRGNKLRRNDTWGHNPSGMVQGGARDNCHNRDATTPRGRYAWLDHNHQTFDPNLICKACK